MKNIGYLELFKKSWKITWKKRFLWWFGLFLALGEGGFGFNFLSGKNNWGEKMNIDLGKIIEDFFSNHQVFMFSLAVFFLFIFLVFSFLKILAYAGIIKSLEAIEMGKTGSFREYFNKGKKYFWDLLLVSFSLGLIGFCVIFVLAVPVVFLFFFQSIIFGILAAVFALIIIIPVIILLSYVGKYAKYYVVISNIGVKNSLEAGYSIFRKNIFESIMLALFFLPLSMILGIIFLVLLLLLALVFVTLGFLLHIIIPNTAIIISIMSGISVFLIIMLATSSIYQVFNQTVWFLFFKEIASIKEEKSINEVPQSVTEENIPSPENA